MKQLLTLSGISTTLLFLFTITSQAQLMQGGVPEGLKREVLKEQVEFIQIAPRHLAQYKREDQLTDTITGIPWRFGENIEVNLTPQNSGTQLSLSEGRKLWQTAIYSPGAISLNLVFHPYRVPPGARLFVYTPDGKQILGAFDHRNNQDDGFFATSLVFSDSVIIEYSEPSNAAFTGEVGIASVTHGYRHPKIFTEKAFGDAGLCNVNVACDVAAPYADQIRSVALLLVGSTSFCTGALINNSNNDGTPYILSANHCYRDPATVVFWFNWESENCANPDFPPAHQALSGAVQRARWAYSNFSKKGSDFWLMEMNHLPPYEYNLFYSGWNRTEDPLTIDSVVGIHHPRGDVKKFSWSTDSLQIWGYGSNNDSLQTHWRVRSWDAGTTTEGGSSGSPLMDHQGRIIGQLHGGEAACGNTLPDWYGRFSVSWDGDNIPTRQLRPWLDPGNLNPVAIDGYQPVYYMIESSINPNGGGTIDPSFYVMENRSHTFHIVPQVNWLIEDVLVNGISVGAVESYTFVDVTSENTIQAFFTPITYTITATAGENGTI
ncbi:MAG: trypsin-like serine peptidase, partial [Bacteroidota bacterium]